MLNQCQLHSVMLCQCHLSYINIIIFQCIVSTQFTLPNCNCYVTHLQHNHTMLTKISVIHAELHFLNVIILHYANAIYINPM